MRFLFVQEKAGVAKCGVLAERAPEHTCPGVSAVLMVMQGLPVLCCVRAKLALVNRSLGICVCGVLQLHVVAQFSFSLAGVCTHLTDQGFFLVTEFMAVQLVDAVATIWTLITFVPERDERQVSKIFFSKNQLKCFYFLLHFSYKPQISSMLTHVDTEIVFPFCNISTF